MSDLHDVARKWGVETHYGESHDVPHAFYIGNPRPDLDIAHDLLAKLPVQMGIADLSYNFIERVWHFERKGFATFPEAVLALARRAKP